jgi:hypothetical protein
VTRATLDSNIYISALEFGGGPARLLWMGRVGLIRVDISDAILDETLGVLRDKFAWDAYRLHFARVTRHCLPGSGSPYYSGFRIMLPKDLNDGIYILSTMGKPPMNYLRQAGDWYWKS